MKFSRTILPFCAAIVLTTGLVACSSEEPVEIETKPSASESTPEPTETTEATADGDFTAAEWANPVTNPGELLTTVEGTNFTVDVYQVGTDIATSGGQFVDPDTMELLLAEGDEIVFVNYVATNTSDADIPLSASLVNMTARYADWKYMQGMDAVVDFDLDEKMGINRTAIAPSKAVAPYIWKAGESFSFGQNFKYQPDSAITFAASLTESDAEGDLDHDTRQEVKVETTIQ